MIKTTPFALVAALALGACAQPNTSASIAPGTTVYAGSEVGRAMSTTENCRIAGVRQVVINGDSAADQRQANARRTTGTLLGGATGAVIGNQIGGGSGKKAATVIGAIVGASVGQGAAERADAQARLRSGLEYTVQVGNQRRVVVQEYNGVVIQRGQSCRLVGHGSNIRVMPS